MPAKGKTGGKALGRGLEAIFGENLNNALEQIQNGQSEIPSTKETVQLKDVRPNPYQPRTVFDEAKLQELAESIKAHGVFTPILVKKSIRGYEIVTGERRVRASKMAGLTEIPAIIVDFTDDQMMEIAMLENIQREDLSVIEEAQGYSKMVERLGYTQEQLAKRVGKSREHVTNTMRLLKLPKEVQQMVIDGELSMGHVRALLSLEKDDILKVAKKAAKEGMSVRAVEALVKELHTPKQPKQKKDVSSVYSYPQKLMSDKLSTKVTITNKNISIHFENDDDLNRILELLNVLED
ncbi:MAG: ParB/RepB/Spo0J family partition protein [Erysipelotrichales bacterium]|nr:ParB/RepB/Spo0J family partition protein [Erysipelotrichales bacterium]